MRDLRQVKLASKLEEIFSRCDGLQFSPYLGSTNMPDAVRERFGEGARKLCVYPFDVFYFYDREKDTAVVLGLLHQRAVH